jgi:hypothetical protein
MHEERCKVMKLTLLLISLASLFWFTTNASLLWRWTKITVGFEVLTMANMQMTSCSLAECERRWVGLLALLTFAASTYETSINFYQTSRNNPEYNNLQHLQYSLLCARHTTINLNLIRDHITLAFYLLDANIIYFVHFCVCVCQPREDIWLNTVVGLGK